MNDELLDLLDRGAVRDAVARLAAPAPTPSEQIVQGWAATGQGDAIGAIAALRPLVASLESAGTDATVRRQHAHALLALGVASVLGGQADGGTALLERALTLHTSAWPRAQCLRFCALALEQRGAWEGAAARYEAAAATYRTIDHHYGLGSALYGAATALAELGDDARAWPLLLEAVEALRVGASGPALGAALGQLATLAVEREGAAALALVDEADALTSGVPGMYAWDSKLRRAEVLLRLGRSHDALAPIEVARELVPRALAEAAWVDHLGARALLDLGRVEDAASTLALSETERRGPALLPGAVRLERAALCLAIAARLSPPDGVAADAALDELDRGVRARWHRRGVERLIVEAGLALASQPDLDRAARALHVSVALGARLDGVGREEVEPRPATRDRQVPRATLHALRRAGARIPLGPLWLEARIGRGGMGEVWRATHRGGGEVAVKLLRGDGTREHAELFEAEVQAVARLDHPNVVRVLAAQRVDPVAAEMLAFETGATGWRAGTPALVMELVRGGSLDAHLSGWRWPEARDLLLDLLAALGHAHARGILHLDLKPGNVLIDDTTGTRVPRLTDFGLAGLARREDATHVFGTPAYMAPEQARPGAALGPAADLYALGCLAWQLFTGRVPYPTTDVLAQLAQHQSSRIPGFEPTTSVPTGLESWLHILLAKRAEQRFACAADAASALASLGDPGGIGVPPPVAGGASQASAGPPASGETLFPGVVEALDDTPVPGSALSHETLFPGDFASGRSFSGDLLPVGDTLFPGAFEALAEPVARDTGDPSSGRVPVPSRVDVPSPTWRLGSGPNTVDGAPEPATGASASRFSRGEARGASAPEERRRGGDHSVSTPLGPRAAPFRLDWRAAVQQAPLPFLPGVGEGLFAWRVGRIVGREPERDLLWSALGRVHADGRARVVWVHGADGLGRSALLAWLVETADATGAARVVWSVDAARAPGRPALLVLDDVDVAAAERTILALVGTATLLVIALARAAVRPGGAPGGGDAPTYGGVGEHITLGPLTEAELAAIVDDRMPLDRGLRTRLAARAAGSPAFAVALLTDLVRRDALEPGPEGFRVRGDDALALPEDLRGLWTARIDALAPAGSPRRSAWELAAILGPAVPIDVWSEACRRVGLLPDIAAFDLLEAEGWMVRTHAATAQFRVPAVLEALVAAAEASGRAGTWHSVVADVLDRGDVNDPTRARHLAAAGRHAEALGPLRRAAADAVNATRLEECRALIDLWDRSADALGMAPDDPRRASPIVVRVHLALHTRDDPYRLIEHGLRVATPDVACQLTYTLGWVLAQDGRHAEAEGAYKRAVGLAGELDIAYLRLLALIGHAGSVYALGRDADPLLDEARVLLDGRADLGVRIDACAGRGHLRLGRYASALALLTGAVVGARRVGAPDVEAEALADLAELYASGSGAPTWPGDAPRPPGGGTESVPDDTIGCLEAAVAALAATGSDKALVARVRLAGAFVCAGRDDDARAALAPLQQRFAWRLRPSEAAEIALVSAALDGGVTAGPTAALGAAAEVPAVRRLLAEVARRGRGR